MISSTMAVPSELGTTDEIIEYCFEHGWTDGLPVIPPTSKDVRRFLDAAALKSEEIVVDDTSRHVRATAEMLAVNAVMAGCRPEYFPVVVAATRAMYAPEFLLENVNTASSAFPLIIVNGPQGKALGFNSGQYVLGSGNRANATVGRALGLIHANCLGARVGEAASGSMAHRRWRALCFAENEETEWAPLHVQRGFSSLDNVVTVFPSGAAPLPLTGSAGLSADLIADRVALRILAAPLNLNAYLLVISPALQGLFLREGWSKQMLGDYLRLNTWTTIADLSERLAIRGVGDSGDLQLNAKPDLSEDRVYVFRQNENPPPGSAAESSRRPEILVVVAGGDAGLFGSFIPSANRDAMPVSLAMDMHSGSGNS